MPQIALPWHVAFGEAHLLLDLKAFGARLAARNPDSQTVEIQMCAARLNRSNAFSTAEIVCPA